MRTIMNTDREILRGGLAAAGTALRRVARLNFRSPSASLCRFADDKIPKLMPRYVRDAPVQASPVPALHLLDLQLLKDDHLIFVHQTVRELVSKVAAFVRNALMDACHNPLATPSLWRSLLALRQATLGSCQGLLLLLKETWVGNLLACGKRSERFQPHIDTDNFGRRQESQGLDLAREAGIPLPRCRPSDGQSPDLAWNGAMEDDLDLPNLGEPKPLVFPKAGIDELEARLWVGEGIIAAFAFESWVSRFLCVLAAAKERLECQINTGCDILERLRVDRIQQWTLLLELRDAAFGLHPRDRTLFLLPSVPTVSERVVVEPATLFKCLFEKLFLALGRMQSVLKCLTHLRMSIAVLGWKVNKSGW